MRKQANRPIISKRLLASIIICVFLMGCVIAYFWFIPRGGDVKGMPDTYETEGSWDYAYCEKWDYCILTGWHWDGDADHMTIEVPEAIDGRTITKLSDPNLILGPFEVILPVALESQYGNIDMMTEDENCVSDPADYDIYTFTIHTNGQVETIYAEHLWFGNSETEEWCYKIEYVIE